MIAVVPLAGTWIETFDINAKLFNLRSFPLRERGLKLIMSFLLTYSIVSFPLRERGLKLHVLIKHLSKPRRSPCGNVD